MLILFRLYICLFIDKMSRLSFASSTSSAKWLRIALAAGAGLAGAAIIYRYVIKKRSPVQEIPASYQSPSDPKSVLKQKLKDLVSFLHYKKYRMLIQEQLYRRLSSSINCLCWIGFNLNLLFVQWNECIISETFL